MRRPPKLVLKNLASNGITTQYQLDDVPCSHVILQAHPSNAGLVFFGDSTVTNASGAKPGIQLAAGVFSPMIPVENLNQLYAATATNNDDIIAFCV